MLEKILDEIFPPICGICHKWEKQGICPECYQMIRKMLVCKIQNQDEQKQYYKKQMFLFPYEGLIRDLLISYKFGEQSYLYHTFAEIIVKDKKICRFLKSYDIIIPVPVHRKRKWERGYNQTELIAKKVGKALEIEVETKTLIKTKNIKPQSSLTKEQRIKNIQNVYAITNMQKVVDKKILILDDIYTTGSTVRECSKTLQEAGAKEIGIVTIAKD